MTDYRCPKCDRNYPAHLEGCPNEGRDLKADRIAELEAELELKGKQSKRRFDRIIEISNEKEELEAELASKTDLCLAADKACKRRKARYEKAEAENKRLRDGIARILDEGLYRRWNDDKKCLQYICKELEALGGAE